MEQRHRQRRFARLFRHMFTGLVETTGKVISLEPRGDSARLTLNVGAMAVELVDGESVAVNGCCLTVIC